MQCNSSTNINKNNSLPEKHIYLPSLQIRSRYKDMSNENWHCCGLISRTDIEKFMGSSSLGSLGTGFWFSDEPSIQSWNSGWFPLLLLYSKKKNRFISEITVWMKKS